MFDEYTEIVERIENIRKAENLDEIREFVYFLGKLVLELIK